MMPARVRPYAWIGIVMSLVVGSYSVMGMIMAQSMNSAYAANRSDHGLLMWGISALASVVVLVFCVAVVQGGRR
jgi:cellobiose-specific phosphotransferase system component IIC